MNEATKAAWKQKIIRETLEYWTNLAYLLLYFGLFAWYRRLILAEYGISYFHYGASFVEAVVLAKVAMIGGFLRLGRTLENRSLILPTLHKTVVFSLCVGLLGIIEHSFRGVADGKGLAAGFANFMNLGKYEWLAKCLVTFFAFIPFFAFKELGRVLGEGKIRRLFFQRTAATDSDLFREQGFH